MCQVTDVFQKLCVPNQKTALVSIIVFNFVTIILLTATLVGSTIVANVTKILILTFTTVGTKIARITGLFSDECCVPRFLV